MQKRAEAVFEHPPAAVFRAVRVLDGYPRWLSIVRSVAPAAPHADDAGPAWFVDLGAGLGPFRLTKRLRMVRTGHENGGADRPSAAVFERLEHDGEEHGRWQLDVTVTPRAAQTHVAVDLRYDGAGWSAGSRRCSSGSSRRRRGGSTAS